MLGNSTSANNKMMKLFVVFLGIFAVFEMVSCRPSAPTPGAITRDIKVELPGSERINRRSADDWDTSDSSSDDDTQEEYDESSTDSYSSEDATIVERAAPEFTEDMENAESNMVFRPLFVSRKRAVEKTRVTRSADEGLENPKGDELDTAENGMVFLPLFRSRNRFEERQRLRRSVEVVGEEKLDDMEGAENGMVFLPLFRSKNEFGIRRRSRRATDTDVKTHVSGSLDDLEGAEDLVFKPLFRQHKIRPVRAIQEESMKGGLDDLAGDDMAAAENGLIFRPLFRTRQRDI